MAAKRNGPKSIKAMTRGIGVGMSFLPNQPVQTTAIPQTPAVCTAAVKWKNTIHSPNSKRKSDTEAILEKDENATTAETSEGLDKSKQWPDMAKSSSKAPQAPTATKPTGKTKDSAKNGKIKAGPKNAKPKKGFAAVSIAVGKKAQVVAATSTTKKAAEVTTTDSSKTPPTSADTNSTARASLVEVGEEKEEASEPETSPVHQPRQQQVAIKVPKEGDEKEEEKNVTRAENKLITAIPTMPLFLAGMCMFLNIFLPGSGTIIASFSVFCCSKKKELDGTGKKENSVDVMITNLCVGVSQMFTVTFLFIGLIWSITWGVFMVQFAWTQYKKDKEEKERLAAISVANAFMIPGMR